MPFFRNSRGQLFQSSLGGVFPVNDGDPQNDVDFEGEEPDCEPDYDAIAEARENREYE